MVERRRLEGCGARVGTLSYFISLFGRAAASTGHFQLTNRVSPGVGSLEVEVEVEGEDSRGVDEEGSLRGYTSGLAGGRQAGGAFDDSSTTMGDSPGVLGPSALGTIGSGISS